MVRRSPPLRRFFSIALLPLPFFLLLVFSGCEDSVGPENEGVCALQSEIPVSECQALVAFFESTNGQEWESSTNWTESAAPCSWYGITCENGTVIEINLNQNHLTGSLNPELANLTKLKEFWVGMNELGGTIPPELGDLSRLKLFLLHDNLLEGSIPLEVIQLGGAMENEGDNCQFLPGGNENLFIADNDENRAADLDADGSICGVPVPAGTS